MQRRKSELNDNWILLIIGQLESSSEESNIDVFQAVCRYSTAPWFLLPLAISATRVWCAQAHKQPFFQLFNKSCANFLQISARHGWYNLQASFAESRQAIVCTQMNPLPTAKLFQEAEYVKYRFQGTFYCPKSSKKCVCKLSTFYSQ